jgi:hypothetical protein
VLVFTGVCLASCAIQEPPPGGPVDDKPPRVVSTVPEAGLAGVDPETEIWVEFDEPMTKSRFERFITSHPRIVVGKTGWRKRAFVLQPQEPLHPDTTYIVELKSGFSDAHSVQNPEAFRFAFATSAAVDSGSIAGHVLFRRQPSRNAVLRLFVMPKDTAFTPEGAVGDRETAVGREGEFAFNYLPTDDRDFIIWTFEDTDANGAYVTDTDVAVGMPDTVPLGPSNPRVDDLTIFIVDPKEPGKVSGKIINSTGVDTLPVMVTMHELTDTMPPTYVSVAAPDGEFVFPSVLQGRYTLQAFMDFRADSLCGLYPCVGDSTRQCVEPCAQYPDTVTMRPGDERALASPLVLEPPPKE